MNDTIELRPATPEDHEFVYNLNRVAMHEYIEATWGWDDAWQQRDFNENFGHDSDQVIVLNGQDIGRVAFFPNENELFLKNIQLLPEYQNRGIGSCIVTGIIEEAKLQGRSVALKVLKVNPARRFYERLGFTVESEHDTYFKMRRV